MGRVDPGTARVTAVTPLEELDTAVTTLAVGAGGVWVGGALPLSPVPRVVVDRIDPPSGRSACRPAPAAVPGRPKSRRPRSPAREAPTSWSMKVSAPTSGGTYRVRQPGRPAVGSLVGSA
jgi:hypothetical protein